MNCLSVSILFFQDFKSRNAQLKRTCNDSAFVASVRFQFLVARYVTTPRIVGPSFYLIQNESFYLKMYVYQSALLGKSQCPTFNCYPRKQAFILLGNRQRPRGSNDLWFHTEQFSVSVTRHPRPYLSHPMPQISSLMPQITRIKPQVSLSRPKISPLRP